MNHRTEILPGVYLTAVQSDKFKTGCFSLNLLRPMKKEEAAANALIPSVLLRGSETCPDIASISAKLDELYGASIWRSSYYIPGWKTAHFRKQL